MDEEKVLLAGLRSKKEDVAHCLLASRIYHALLALQSWPDGPTPSHFVHNLGIEVVRITAVHLTEAHLMHT